VEPVPVRHLADAVAYLRGELEPDPVLPVNGAAPVFVPDLADVRGQERARCGSRWRTASSRSRGRPGGSSFPARFQLVATTTS
jgi:predicted ATPase with chaperone activity